MKILANIIVTLATLAFPLANASDAPVPERCFFNGTYDIGLLSPTARDLIGKNLPSMAINQLREFVGMRDLAGPDNSSYLIYSYVRLADLTPKYLLSGSPLEALLNRHLIAIAYLTQVSHGPASLNIIADASFESLTDRSDFDQDVLVMDAYGGGQPALTDLLKHRKNDFLFAIMPANLDQSSPVCFQLP